MSAPMVIQSGGIVQQCPYPEGRVLNTLKQFWKDEYSLVLFGNSAGAFLPVTSTSDYVSCCRIMIGSAPKMPFGVLNVPFLSTNYSVP